jgi:hypothetical protein
VTVVDPRHPLFNQTFPVFHIKNKQEMVPCCQVRLPEGVERLLPIQVTDLAEEPPVVFPVPLGLSSLQALAQAFLRIQAQLGAEGSNGTTGDTCHSRDSDCASPGVGNVKRQPTDRRFANGDPDLPGDRRSVGPGGEA